MSGYWDILAADAIERRLELARLPQGWAALGLMVLVAGLLYAAILFYRRERRAGASTRTRVLLAGLRCAVILSLAVIWLEPILATYIHRRIESSTLLLADGSASMSLSDRYLDPQDGRRVERALEGIEGSDAATMSRAQLVRALLTRDDASLLRRLAANNAVQVYRFGDKPTLLGHIPRGGGNRQEGKRGGEGRVAGEKESGARETSEQPDLTLAELGEAGAPATDIGRAVRHAIESQAGRPVAAVVVLSDGRFNLGEAAEVVARYARAKKIAIHAVGVGDPSPPRNVAVAAVEAPANVFVEDPFRVTAHLRAEGLEGARLTVEMLERSGGSQDAKLIDSKRITVGTAGRIEPVIFDHQISQAQEVQLLVRVPAQGAETFTADNHREITIRALASKMGVLLVAGQPSWEYRYLTRLLERDATIDLSCWLQSADEEAVREGNTVIDRFPRQREELFGYDCIVLLNPQPGDFDPAWTSHVEALVSGFGAGLLYVAGRTYTPRFARDPDALALLDLLPVVLDPTESELLLNELGHYQSTAWPVALAGPVANHPVLTLSDQPGENAQIWARLPGVYWHYPVRREKPVATVFLRHSNPRMRNTYGGHVLLATQFFGSGRTGFLAFDTTWRWRRFGDRYFNRFWVQLLRHMVEGKLLTGQKRGLIQLEREVCAIGEPVAVEARLLDTRLMPLKHDRIEVTIEADGRRQPSATLTAQPDRPGWYRGQFVPTRIGTHVLRIDLPGIAGVPAAVIRGEVRVGQADLEFRRTHLDRQSLAILTSQSAGGRYLEIDQLDELVSLIPSKTTRLILTGRPTPLWDRWWTLALLVVLLGTEWAVRKRSRLL